MELRSFPRFHEPLTRPMAFKVSMATATGVGVPAGALLGNPLSWILITIALGGGGAYLALMKAGCFLGEAQTTEKQLEIDS